LDVEGEPRAPKLPDVESPPPEEMLDGVPSPEEVVEQARTVDEVIDEQPSVDEILGRDGD
jgi:hypothetical protein